MSRTSSQELTKRIQNALFPVKWTAIEVLKGGPSTFKSEIWSWAVARLGGMLLS